MEQLFDMLEACSELQKMKLKHCGPKFPKDSVGYPEPTRNIHLPALEHVEIEDEALFIAQILANTNIPSSKSLVVTYQNKLGDLYSDVVPAILPRDRSHFTRLTSVRTLEFHAMVVGLQIIVSIPEQKFTVSFEMQVDKKEIENTDELDSEYQKLLFPFIASFVLQITSFTEIEDIAITLSEVYNYIG